MDRPACADPKRAPGERWVCVFVPELPLQVMLREHPEWAQHPAAVIEADKPHAPLLWVNEHGQTHGIAPGQRYSTALSLCRELRASTITTTQIHHAVERLCTLLRRFSPHVEPSTDEPGVVWIDGTGLRLLYASLSSWARSIQRALHEAGFNAHVVAGFTRFFTYALARAQRSKVLCFADAIAERNAAQSVPLSRLHLDPNARDTLVRLGVHTVGAFLSLPSTGLLERFGPTLHALHQLASEQTWAPLQPTPEVLAVTRRQDLDDAEHDANRLLFVIKHELDAMLRTLASRQRALQSLKLHCPLESRATEAYAQTITPAEPTLDGRLLLDLVRLRLEASPLPAAATAIALEAIDTAATAEQLRLLTERPPRDLAAADRALARVRAELGDDAVTRAVLHDAHLPEARFRFEPLDHVVTPSVSAEPPTPVAIRRLWTTPQEASLVLSRATRHAGPFVIAGGWWNRHVQRRYYFVETARGELLYCFYDVERGRWLVHGGL